MIENVPKGRLIRRADKTCSCDIVVAYPNLRTHACRNKIISKIIDYSQERTVEMLFCSCSMFNLKLFGLVDPSERLFR